MRSLPDRLVRHLTEIDHENHEAWLAAIDVGADYHPIAVARFVRDASSDRAAEIALTVIDDYQHRGVGKMLMFILAESAALHGVKTFTALVHSDNWPMQNFLKKFGGIVDSRAPESINIQLNVKNVINDLSGKFEFAPAHHKSLL